MEYDAWAFKLDFIGSQSPLKPEQTPEYGQQQQRDPISRGPSISGHSRSNHNTTHQIFSTETVHRATKNCKPRGRQVSRPSVVPPACPHTTALLFAILGRPTGKATIPFSSAPAVHSFHSIPYDRGILASPPPIYPSQAPGRHTHIHDAMSSQSLLLLLLPGQVAWLLLLLLLVACCLLLFMAAKMQKKHEQRPLCLLRPSPPLRGPVRPFSFPPDIRYRRLPCGEHYLRDAISPAWYIVSKPRLAVVPWGQARVAHPLTPRAMNILSDRTRMRQTRVSAAAATRPEKQPRPPPMTG